MWSDQRSNHTTKNHMNVKDKWAKYEFIQKTYMKCKLCSRPMMFTNNAMGIHARKHHDMNFKKFKKMHIMNKPFYNFKVKDCDVYVEKLENQEKYSDIACILQNGISLSIVKETDEEIRKEEDLKQEEEVKQEPDIEEDKDDIQYKEHLEYSVQEKDKRYSDDPLEMCRVQCKICSREMWRTSISSHMAREHPKESQKTSYLDCILVGEEQEKQKVFNNACIE